LNYSKPVPLHPADDIPKDLEVKGGGATYHGPNCSHSELLDNPYPPEPKPGEKCVTRFPDFVIFMRKTVSLKLIFVEGRRQKVD
jgi:hypothetical protein